MKLNSDFIFHSTGEETVLVPVGGAAFAGIGKGNATMGDILSLLQEDISEAELVAAMAERYDAPAELLQRDVARVLEQLRSVGALDE